MAKSITTPLTREDVEDLSAGDRVLLTGRLLTARDAAHKRLIALLDKGEDLPVELEGQVIYYVGPTPPRPGKVIGSAGPTTAGRMDAFTPRLLERGLRGMIGKGYRSPEVKEALARHGAVYMAAVGGAAALIAERIKAARVVAYEDLGPEAIRELEVVEFPALVINDAHGGDLYEQGRRQYERKVAP